MFKMFVLEYRRGAKKRSDRQLYRRAPATSLLEAERGVETAKPISLFPNDVIVTETETAVQPWARTIPWHAR